MLATVLPNLVVDDSRVEHTELGLSPAVRRRTLAPLLRRAKATQSDLAPGEDFDFGRFVGRSPKMRQVYARIRRAAEVDSTVLILGESGTGKELVAQALHEAGSRKNGPLVAVNCAAVPAGLIESELFGHVRGAFTGALDRRVGRFEQADGGTLLIDEIGDFALGLQAKLLRVLETLIVTPVGGATERKTDVRVVAATSRDILQMVRDETFRSDLFYRLNVISISLPPLREHAEDIPLLVTHFLEMLVDLKHVPARHISPALMRQLVAYQWPGNVRELRNAIESMMVLAEGETLTTRDLPERIAAALDAQGVDQPEPALMPSAMPASISRSRAQYDQEDVDDTTNLLALRIGGSRMACSLGLQRIG